MKAYIVTSGEYSSYCIDAVFLTYEQAVKYIEIRTSDGWSEFQIEEYEINESAPKTDKLMWRVEYENLLWRVERTEEMWTRKPVLHSDKYLGDVYPYDRFYMTVFAKDKMQALKIAQDTYAKMKAEREGL